MQIILDELGRLETEAVRQIPGAGTLEILEELRVGVLGKKGRLTAILPGDEELALGGGGPDRARLRDERGDW